MSDDPQADAGEVAPTHCLACGRSLSGVFCSNCGQSHRYPRLHLRELLDGVLEGVLELDTRILRTLGDLTVAPARVCRDYIEGRRVPYIHPFRYALGMTALAILAARGLAWLHGLPADAHAATRFEFQLAWGQLVNFLAMPVMALLLWIVFSRAPRRFNWVETYTFVLYGFGHAALLQALTLPLVPHLGSLGQQVHAAIPIAYLAWVAVELYEVSGWWRLAAVAAVALASVGLMLSVYGVISVVVPGLLA